MWSFLDSVRFQLLCFLLDRTSRAHVCFFHSSHQFRRMSEALRSARLRSRPSRLALIHHRWREEWTRAASRPRTISSAVLCIATTRACLAFQRTMARPVSVSRWKRWARDFSIALYQR